MLNKSLLFHLREAARVESNELTKWKLKDVADNLDTAITTFAADPTTDNMIAVNGLWSRAYRMLGPDGVTGGKPGGNGAGLTEGALLQQVA
jgi:hypothetical protein